MRELPEFYRNLLSVWAQDWHIFITSETNCPTDVLKQQLFNNKFVLRKKDALFDNDFYTRVLCKVGDLYSDDSQLKQEKNLIYNLDTSYSGFQLFKCIPKKLENVSDIPVSDIQSSSGNTAAHALQNLHPK